LLNIKEENVPRGEQLEGNCAHEQGTIVFYTSAYVSVQVGVVSDIPLEKIGLGANLVLFTQ
jgi:hypothetical protein